MKKILLFSLIISLTFSCKPEAKNKPIPKKQKQEKRVVKDPKFADLEPIPKELLKKLSKEVTFIDYIFYDLPFSLSVDNRPSINANLNHISSKKIGAIEKSCKPIAREFFQVDGEILYEAEIYFQDGCKGIVFLEKEKPIYANTFKKVGIDFYNNIVNSKKQTKSGALNEK